MFGRCLAGALSAQPDTQREMCASAVDSPDNYGLNMVETGKSKILNTVRDVVGLHKDRYVVPLKIAVTKVSGTGSDSLFMGALQVRGDL
jgi:hypothetical protein